MFHRCGKDKPVALIGQRGLVRCASAVEQILGKLKKEHRLVEPGGKAVSAKRRRSARLHTKSQSKEYRAEQPGEFVLVDTLVVRPLPGVVLKQFTA